MIRRQPDTMIDEDQLRAAADVVGRRLGPFPEIAIILGSGLGSFVQALEESVSIPTREIPHYPASTVVGHRGVWVRGRAGEREVLAVQGRVHAYEGYSHAQVVFPVHLLAECGVRKLLITNAAGGINRFFRPGDFMAIADHINLTFENPLWGPNPRRLGPRFPDMHSAYDPRYTEMILEEGRQLGLRVHKGVYLGVKGPSYETAAEIRMGERIGADVVGMSTVPEVIAAVYRGLRVAAISCITNMATGISLEKLSHEEVTRIGERVKEDFARLVTAVVQRMAGE